MRARVGHLLFALVVFTGCKTGSDYELPAGWEDARRIEVFQGPATAGCSSETSISVNADVNEGRVGAVVDGVVLSCAQPYEGFVREREGGWDLLLQPVDMHPDGLAGCVCATKLRGVLGSGAVGDEVAVFQRPSFEEDAEGEPVALGNANAQDVPAGCADLVPCDVDTPCANAGNEDPEEYWEDCISVVDCGAVCISPQEACMIECGTLDCAILESYPEQVSCE